MDGLKEMGLLGPDDTSYQVHAEETSFSDVSIQGHLDVPQELMFRVFKNAKEMENMKYEKGKTKSFVEDAAWMSPFFRTRDLTSAAGSIELLKTSKKIEEAVYTDFIKCPANDISCAMEAFCTHAVGVAFEYTCLREIKPNLQELPISLGLAVMGFTKYTGELVFDKTDTTRPWSNPIVSDPNYGRMWQRSTLSSGAVFKDGGLYPISASTMYHLIVDVGIQLRASDQAWIRDFVVSDEYPISYQCVTAASVYNTRAYTNLSFTPFAVQLIIICVLLAWTMWTTLGSVFIFSIEYLLSRTSSTSILLIQVMLMLWGNSLEIQSDLFRGNDAATFQTLIVFYSFLGAFYSNKIAFCRSVSFNVRTTMLLLLTMIGAVLIVDSPFKEMASTYGVNDMELTLTGDDDSACTGYAYCTRTSRATVFFFRYGCPLLVQVILGEIVARLTHTTHFKSSRLESFGALGSRPQNGSKKATKFEKWCLGVDAETYFGSAVPASTIVVSIEDQIRVVNSMELVLAAGFFEYSGILVRQRDFMMLVATIILPATFRRNLNLTLTAWTIVDGIYVDGGEHTTPCNLHRRFTQQREKRMEERKTGID